MPRGGLRPGAGGSLEHLIKPKWKLGPTQVIRVPRALAPQLLELAHKLDNSDVIDSLQVNNASTTHSNTQQEAIAILESALNLKPNSGGAIKKEIRKALQLLEGNHG